MGFTSILTLIFITLKLTNFIDWPWWLVVSPLIIALSGFIAAFFVLSYKTR